MGETNMSDFIFALIGFFILAFIFHGEPDLWDKAHAYVMKMETCK
jgi:hypothetical protein